MVRCNLLICAVFAVATLLSAGMAWGQSATQVYNSIKENPSRIRWCLPQAGDDPAGIIRSRCKIYSECLESAGLNQNVDHRNRVLPQSDAEELRKCHQALYNAARMNPEIKGSKATQDWLLREVHSGTEAKSFSVPSSMNHPR